MAGFGSGPILTVAGIVIALDLMVSLVLLKNNGKDSKIMAGAKNSHHNVSKDESENRKTNLVYFNNKIDGRGKIMKNKGLLIVLAVIGSIALLGIAAAAGFFWGRGGFNGACCQGFGGWNTTGFGRGMFGRGMMGGGRGFPGFSAAENYAGSVLTFEEAENAINKYIADTNSAEELRVQEIMLFDNHAYGMVVEEATGIGAFEVLVDPRTLDVFPEMGPNMMWNLKYSRMRAGMMGGNLNNFSAEMPISGEEAIGFANEYLSSNGSDLVAEGHPDPFYGYYTIHTVKNGEVVGMLSVNGYDGEVFLHTWHGTFLDMSEHEADGNS